MPSAAKDYAADVAAASAQLRDVMDDPATALYSIAALASVAESQPQVPLTDAGIPVHVTPFHSASVPPISLVSYAKRVVKYSRCGYAGVGIGLVLLGRYLKATGERPDRLTVHRLLLASVVVGIKAHFDVFYSNAYYAQVGGISTKEMNKLEVTLLVGLRFSAMASAAEARELLQGLSAAGQLAPLDDEGWPQSHLHPHAVATAAHVAAAVLHDAPRQCTELTGPPASLPPPPPPQSRPTSNTESPITVAALPAAAEGDWNTQHGASAAAADGAPLHQDRSPDTAGGGMRGTAASGYFVYDQHPSPFDTLGGSPWTTHNSTSPNAYSEHHHHHQNAAAGLPASHSSSSSSLHAQQFVSQQQLMHAHHVAQRYPTAGLQAAAATTTIVGSSSHCGAYVPGSVPASRRTSTASAHATTSSTTPRGLL